MNIQQLITLSQQTGFPDPATAAAIAMAESSGRVDVIGDRGLPKAGCASYGLWQINVCPGRDPYDPARLRTADYNARAAYERSSSGTNWRPWTTYRTGAYRKYLTQGQAAAGQQRPASDGGQSTGLPVETVPSPPDESGIALPPALIVAALAVVAALAFG